MNPAAFIFAALLAGVDEPVGDPDAGRVAVVLDGTPACERALHVATTLALRQGLSLLLLAWKPEQGASSPAAGNTEQVLLAARASAEREGVAAAYHLLCGPLPLAQLRSLLGTHDRLVVANIFDLEGPLRGLVRAILLDPPCTLYVVPPVRNGRQPLWAKLLAWLLRRGWGPARSR